MSLFTTMPRPDPPTDSSVPSLLTTGRRYHRSGLLDKAAACYRSVLAAQPANPDALYLLGLVAYRRGDTAEAIRLVNEAIRADAGHALARGSLGQICQDRGDDEAAAAHFQKAAALRPGNPELRNGLGLSLARLGRLESAAAAFRAAIRIKPDMPEAHNNLGNIQRRRDDPDGAEQSYRRCIALRPDFAEAHNNLGVLYQQQQRPGAARRQFESAIAARTGYAEAHSNLGAVLNDQGDTDGALIQFHNAMDLEPSFSEACVNAGMALHKLGDHERARETLDLAAAIAPGNPTAAWARCMAELDAVYPSTEAMFRARRGYERRLKELVKATTERNPGDRRQVQALVGSMQPFLLAYQGQDDTVLQCLYGDHVHAVMQNHAGASPSAASRETAAFPPSHRPLRVGMVSAFFYDHSNWKVPIQGWLTHLAGRVELYGYYTGFRSDAATKRAASLFHRFHRRQSVEQLAASIQRDGIDVLIYPEVGMHPVTARLAAQRLAPVQCASWGHPVTTGLPTMDYFLSSDLMEPDGAQAAYRETLVRLPGLSFACEAPARSDGNGADRAQFGLVDEQIVYLCVQNLSKYLPRHDPLLAEIAGRVPGSRLVFIEGAEYATAILKNRLRRAFDDAGVEFDAHVTFLSRLDENRYRALNRIGDVFLDTPEWSGCNSALEALACDVPVVTLPGQWMRGRHVYALYRKMDYDELTARDETHYVELAVALGHDRDRRRRQRQRIARARPRLYDDPEPVHALADFLHDAAGRAA